MAKRHCNPQAVGELLEAHAQGISSLLFHPVTGSPVEVPARIQPLQASAILLNIYLYDPEVVVVWNNQFQAHHLAVWASYIRDSRYRLAIVCRSMKGIDEVRANFPDTPIWSLEEGSFAYQFLPVAQSLKVFLYPDNERMNEHTVHNHPRQMHVHIGHGDSDKSTSANRFTALYDYVFLADRIARNRYRSAGVEIPDPHFLPIGAPTYPGLEFDPKERSTCRVLYAPTWEGTSSAKNFSSLPDLLPALIQFSSLEGRTLEYRPHAGLGKRDAAYRAHALQLVRWASQSQDKVAQFNASDLLVCDVSGIISEYLFTGKPIVVPVHSDKPWLMSYLQGTGLLDYVYCWHYDRQPLADFLAQIAHDPLRSARLSRREELYAGAKDFSQAAALFDQGLETVMLNLHWRNRRSGHVPPAAPVGSDPVQWAALAQEIREGRLTLTD